MKKQLLALSIITSTMVVAQSPDWTDLQNTNFPAVAAGTRYMDAVNPMVLWATGYNGFVPSENHNWFTVTNDAGATFTSGNVFADTNTYVIASIEGIDATTAYVTSYEKAAQNKGAVHKTVDAGATWTNVCSATMYTNAASFANITTFVDATTGITMGDPTASEFEIYRTTDAGANWAKIIGANIPNPVSGEFGLVDVYTKNGMDIWFGTNKGRVYHSADGGLTWAVGAITGAAQGVSRLAFKDNLNGLAIAYSGTTAAPVFGLYKTINGGTSWTALGTPANVGKSDICAVPGVSMYASCGTPSNNAVLAYSSDDGATWTDWGSTGIQYLKIDFVDNTTGWASTFTDQSIVGSGGIFKYNGLGVATSLKSLAPTANFSVLPNPTNGIVNFTLPSTKNGLTIAIIDALGKTVYVETVKNAIVGESKQLNLETLPKGLYTISVLNGAEKSFSKIIVQ